VNFVQVGLDEKETGMPAEIIVLDWLFAAGQGLFIASFFYFLYLVMRFSRIVPIIRHGFMQGSSEPIWRVPCTEIYFYSRE